MTGMFHSDGDTKIATRERGMSTKGTKLAYEKGSEFF